MISSEAVKHGRVRIDQIGLALGAGAVFAGVVIRGEFGAWLVSCGGVLVLAALPGRIQHFQAMRRWREIMAAFAAGDIGRARVLLEKLSRMHLGTDAQAVYRLLQAKVASSELRFRESRDILEKIDPNHLPLDWRIGRDNDLAWAMMHEGATTEAIAVAERAVAALTPASSAEDSSRSIGTLGIALMKAGRLDEARETLERALAVGGSPSLVAARAFYLGETLVALGHPDEAAETYEKASRAMPDGDYGKHARAALASISKTRPYRG
jgi:tetratricopeptide (TPR) repeat protein